MNALAIALALPAFFALIALEAWVAARRRFAAFGLHDSIASLSCGVSQQATAVFVRGAVIGAYAWLFAHARWRTLPADAWWSWALLALLVDHQYYWFHRASHRVNLLWATHVVHHQSEHYNLTTALRQSALQAVVAAPFYWPLAVAGFSPLMFVAVSTANTLYQFWIHTRLVGKLGPLELVWNTPSHHRVHHGIDPEYIDKNYAGILIVWDRLYGTFVAEGREPAFGTVEPLRSFNALWANVEPWWRLGSAARRTRRLADKVRLFVAPPEWLPEDLGGPVVVPEVDHAARVLFDVPPQPATDRYVVARFAVAGLALTLMLLLPPDGAEGARTALALWVLASAAVWGGLFERRRWAVPVELALLASSPAVAWVVAAALRAR